MTNYNQGKITDKTIVAIPEVFRKPEFRFVLVKKNEKAPWESNWQTKNNYPFNSTIIKNHLKNGGNYGVLSGRGQLACFDADNIDRLTKLGVIQFFDDSGTVKVESSKGFHYYFLSDGEAHGKNVLRDPDIADPNLGQLGDIRFDGNFMTVGPNSHHPSGSVYTLIGGEDFKVIPTADILNIIETMGNGKKSPGVTSTEPVPKKERKRSGSTISDYLNLRVDQFLMPINPEHLSNGDIIGVHPVHGSSSTPPNKNLRIHTTTNTWKCFSSGCGGTTEKPGSNGSGLEAYAVAKGLMECSECQPGWSKANPELFQKILSHLRQDGYGRKIDAWYASYQKRQSEPLVSSLGEMTGIDEEGENCGVENPQLTIETLDGQEFDIPTEAKLTFKLENNLINDYFIHAGKMVDSYDEYHFGCALLALAVFVNRGAYIESTQGTSFTNLYTFLLGKTTISGKSVSINESKYFVEQIAPEMIVANSPGSHIGFIEGLADDERIPGVISPKGHGVLFQDEAAMLLRIMQQPNFAALRDMLLLLWDGSDVTRRLASNKGKKVTLDIKKPYFNLSLATTLETFADANSVLNIESGLLPRFLIFAHTRYREVKDFREWTDEDKTRFGKIFNQFKRYKQFFEKNEVMFNLTTAGNTLYNKWYRDAVNRVQNEYNDLMLAVYGRMKINVLRMAMLMTIGKYNFLDQFNDPEKSKYHAYIDDDCLSQAIDMIDNYFVKNSLYAFSLIGLDNRNNIDKIIRVLQRCPDRMLDRRELLKRSRILAKDFVVTIDTMVESGAIIKRDEKNKRGRDTIYFKLLSN